MVEFRLQFVRKLNAWTNFRTVVKNECTKGHVTWDEITVQKVSSLGEKTIIHMNGGGLLIDPGARVFLNTNRASTSEMARLVGEYRFEPGARISGMRMKNLFKVKKKGYIAGSFRLAVALLYTQYGDRLDECLSPEKKLERVVTTLKGPQTSADRPGHTKSLFPAVGGWNSDLEPPSADRRRGLPAVCLEGSQAAKTHCDTAVLCPLRSGKLACREEKLAYLQLDHSVILDFFGTPEEIVQEPTILDTRLPIYKQVNMTQEWTSCTKKLLIDKHQGYLYRSISQEWRVRLRIGELLEGGRVLDTVGHAIALICWPRVGVPVSCLKPKEISTPLLRTWCPSISSAPGERHALRNFWFDHSIFPMVYQRVFPESIKKLIRMKNSVDRRHRFSSFVQPTRVIMLISLAKSLKRGASHNPMKYSSWQTIRCKHRHDLNALHMFLNTFLPSLKEMEWESAATYSLFTTSLSLFSFFALCRYIFSGFFLGKEEAHGQHSGADIAEIQNISGDTSSQCSLTETFRCQDPKCRENSRFPPSLQKVLPSSGSQVDLNLSRKVRFTSHVNMQIVPTFSTGVCNGGKRGLVHRPVFSCVHMMLIVFESQIKSRLSARERPIPLLSNVFFVFFFFFNASIWFVNSGLTVSPRDQLMAKTQTRRRLGSPERIMLPRPSPRGRLTQVIRSGVAEIPLAYLDSRDKLLDLFMHSEGFYGNFDRWQHSVSSPSNLFRADREIFLRYIANSTQKSLIRLNLISNAVGSHRLGFCAAVSASQSESGWGAGQQRNCLSWTDCLLWIFFPGTTREIVEQPRFEVSITIHQLRTRAEDGSKVLNKWTSSRQSGLLTPRPRFQGPRSRKISTLPGNRKFSASVLPQSICFRYRREPIIETMSKILTDVPAGPSNSRNLSGESQTSLLSSFLHPLDTLAETIPPSPPPRAALHPIYITYHVHMEQQTIDSKSILVLVSLINHQVIFLINIVNKNTDPLMQAKKLNLHALPHSMSQQQEAFYFKKLKCPFRLLHVNCFLWELETKEYLTHIREGHSSLSGLQCAKSGNKGVFVIGGTQHTSEKDSHGKLLGWSLANIHIILLRQALSVSIPPGGCSDSGLETSSYLCKVPRGWGWFSRCDAQGSQWGRKYTNLTRMLLLYGMGFPCRNKPLISLLWGALVGPGGSWGALGGSVKYMDSNPLKVACPQSYQSLIDNNQSKKKTLDTYNERILILQKGYLDFNTGLLNQLIIKKRPVLLIIREGGRLVSLYNLPVL
ncbi:hypothetical protein VP01_901g1 [Puccinia sorghi]|uniref:Uncharacterized protein n=1 Tax=Puccinia sorghi TaxID=27349 RepID=A0A0L6U7R2_9BASI|nr:hypothetical protein VP01_901g1 [Puccinia sorghi]